jgi:glycosyltransferase involved in cell wall biosynthesis
VSGRRAVLVVPEIPSPPRCGNAWRDLQQIDVLRRLGFTVHVVSARPRWDLSDAEEADGCGALGAEVSYLTRAREAPPEPRLATLSRKASYLIAARAHPFGWSLPRGLSHLITGLAGDAADVMLMRSIFVHEIPALRRVWPGRIVVDCHDSDVHLAGELLATVRGAARLGPWANLVGVGRIIARCLPLADEAWAVSREDAARLTRQAPGARVLVVPSGMDRGRAAGAAQPGLDGTALLVANFGYGPNARGAEWLLRAVWPAIRARAPAATLRCVGARMPAALASLASTAPGVDACGPLAEIAGPLRDAAVVLAPLLEGGGTRLKIVEAWSQGKAVVTTPKGVEGLPAPPDAVVAAAAPAEFAAATASLMLDAERRQDLGSRALQVFREQLSWDVAARAVATGSVIGDARPALSPASP